MAKIGFKLKNTGNTSFSFQYIESLEINYNDGYLYHQGLANTSDNIFEVEYNDRWQMLKNFTSTTQLEALDNTEYKFVGYIKVPKEVETNIDKSLNLLIYLYNDDKPSFTYKIR